MTACRSWLLVSGLLAGCAAAPVAPVAPVAPLATVQALRCKLYFVESEFLRSHGGGAWHDCLYLPDAGVMCTVEWQWQLPAGAGASSSGATWQQTPRLHARHVDFAAELARRPAGSTWSDRPPEPVAIDAELARRVVALAELTAQQADLAGSLGARVLGGEALGGPDSTIQESTTYDEAGRLRVVSSR